MTAVNTDSAERTPTTRRTLTRTETAERLGVSARSVRRFEVVGKLTRIVENGIECFDADAIDALARSRPRRLRERDEGTLAALAFDAFSAGKLPRDVVISLRLAPERVAALHGAWLRLGVPAVVLTPDEVRQIEAVVGAGKCTVAGIVSVVREIAKNANAWKQRAEQLAAAREES